MLIKENDLTNGAVLLNQQQRTILLAAHAVSELALSRCDQCLNVYDTVFAAKTTPIMTLEHY